MSNLMASLFSSANALYAFDRALSVVQNNVTNASTPGYAAQRLVLASRPFQPEDGLAGGVEACKLQSARNQYAEQSVRDRLASFGSSAQMAEDLARIEGVFDISGQAGIAGSLSALYDSFSAWSLTPNSTAARQNVIDRAQGVAESFQSASAQLDRASDDLDAEVRDTVSAINQLGATLRDYNADVRRGAQEDAGLDARIHSTLEDLSELVNFTSLRQADGTVTVLLGGQTALVVGDNLYSVTGTFNTPADPVPLYAGAPPTAHILDSAGRDITSSITQGRLGGSLEAKNSLLACLRGDGNEVGDLNRLAMAVADRVNGILTSGLVSDGPPPEVGTRLFQYDASLPTAAAQMLSLDDAITADGLAAIAPGPPYVSNGIALQLSSMADSQDAADQIDGFTHTAFYGKLASRVGIALAQARDDQDFSAQLVAQARSLRSELSGVSLDEEAVYLIEFQRSYQAVARMVAVLDELTETAVNLLR